MAKLEKNCSIIEDAEKLKGMKKLSFKFKPNIEADSEFSSDEEFIGAYLEGIRMLLGGNELKFDANGGLEAPEMMEVETDSATIPTTTPRKPNATFLGWATTANSRSAQYKPGDTIKLKDNTTLYAIYQSDRVIPDIPNTSVDGPKGGASHSAILLIAGLAMAVAAISGKRSA